MSSSPVPMPARSPGRKLAHLLLVLSVVSQLVSAEFMAEPLERTATALESLLYEVHEWVGLVAGAWLSGLIISLLRVPGEWRRLFPWSAEAWAGVTRAIRARLTGKASETELHQLARAWQGAGLLVMVWMCLSGALLAFLPPASGVAEAVREIHELGQGALWTYLAGHVGMALLHSLSGQPIFRRMFWR